LGLTTIRSSSGLSLKSAILDYLLLRSSLPSGLGC